MARKPKQAPIEVKTPVQGKEYTVIQKLRGNINHKSYSAEVGEKVMFNDFEASVFKQFIKE